MKKLGVKEGHRVALLHTLREIGLASGLVDNKVCVIDATWPALRFVTRFTDRRVTK